MLHGIHKVAGSIIHMSSAETLVLTLPRAAAGWMQAALPLGDTNLLMLPWAAAVAQGCAALRRSQSAKALAAPDLL